MGGQRRAEQKEVAGKAYCRETKDIKNATFSQGKRSKINKTLDKNTWLELICEGCYLVLKPLSTDG